MKLLMACLVATALVATPAFAHDEVAKPSTEQNKVQTPSKKVRNAENEAKGHSGGTDKYGCHTNHKTGDYHCHNPK